MPAPWKLWLHGVDEHQADFANRYESWFEDWVADSDRYGPIADFHESQYLDSIDWSQDRAKVVQTLILNRVYGRSRDLQRRPPILAEAEAHVTDTAPNAEVTSTTQCVAVQTPGMHEVSLSDEDVCKEDEPVPENDARVPEHKNDAPVPEHSGSLALARAMRRWPQRVRFPSRKAKNKRKIVQNAVPKKDHKKVPLAARFNRCSPSREAIPDPEKGLRRLWRRTPEQHRQYYSKLLRKHRDMQRRKDLIIKIAKRKRDEREQCLRELALSELGLRERVQHRCPNVCAAHTRAPYIVNPIYWS